jgi:hypothetical protein
MSFHDLPSFSAQATLSHHLHPLRDWALSQQAEADLETIFGSDINWPAAYRWLDCFRKEDYSGIPPVFTLPATDMPGLWGGYSRGTNEIYISDGCPPSQASAVLIEEIGHFLDQQLCRFETPGDEGAKFAACILGWDEMSSASFPDVENSFVFVDGISIPVEAAPGVVRTQTAPGQTLIGSSGDDTFVVTNANVFIQDYLPYTLELGRSFVQPSYQPSLDNRKGMFSLDNLWDGLGAFVLLHPNIKFLFGKVTMYPHYNREGRDLLLYFMNHYFPDNQGLVIPKEKLKLSYETDILSQANPFEGLDYKEGYKVLNRKIRALGENIPPLINAYMNLSPSMKNFGTALNDEFGEVEETGILLTLDDIYESKKHRHMDTFERDRHYGQRPK